jgi:importin-9
LLHFLGDEVALIRSNVAYTVSKIAHLDFPEQWPNFFDELMVCLRSSNVHIVQGAIRVLGDFVRDDLSDLAFPVVAPILMPVLFQLFSDSNIPVDIRAHCVGIVREFGDIIYMVKEEHPEVVAKYVEPLLAMWLDGFLSVLKMELSPENSQIKNEVVKTVVKLVRAFPKQTAPMVPIFMDVIWNELVQLQQMYQQNYVTDDVSDEYQDEEESHLHSILFSAFDFIQMVARKKSIQPIFTKSLKDILKVLMTYLQITCALQSSWSQDMNQFIQDDDEDAMSHTVRISVEQCLANLMDAFPEDAPQCLFHTCMDLFAQSESQKESGYSHWWKIHEACLYAIGRFPEEFTQSSTKGVLDLQFVMRIVLQNMNYSALPFLQGRSLWFSSQFAMFLPSNLVTQYLGAAVEALHSDSVDVAIRIFALKSIRGFLSSIANQEAISHQAAIIEGLLKLVEIAREDCLILLLETLVLVIKVDDYTTSTYEEFISKMVLQLWNSFAQDVFIMELLQELFTAMSSNKFVAVPFQTRMFPVLLSSLSSQTIRSNPQITLTSLDLITSLIKNVADPFPSVYTTDMFPILITMLLETEDSGLLQNGQELLKVLVHRDVNGIISIKVGNSSGLDLLLNFISRMLEPNQSESSAIFIGSLITKLIQKGGDHLVHNLPQLLHAVIYRLDSAKMPAFVETLVLIFCHLIDTQCQTVISFLSEIQLQGYSGLELFVRSFCDSFHDLQGLYTVKLGTMAMMSLLSTKDARLMGIQVKGELIVSNSKRIVTRSRSKEVPDQYTTTNFPIKAMTLLLDEYQSQSESRMQGLKGMKRTETYIETETYSEDEYETCSEPDEDPFGYWGKRY